MEAVVVMVDGKELLEVRLHSGDSSIYGATAEQTIDPDTGEISST